MVLFGDRVQCWIVKGVGELIFSYVVLSILLNYFEVLFFCL